MPLSPVSNGKRRVTSGAGTGCGSLSWSRAVTVRASMTGNVDISHGRNMKDTTGTTKDKKGKPTNRPKAIVARDAATRAKLSNYPELFASRMAGREKRPLGDIFGLSNFGVNLTRLPPHTVSALRHAHSRQDEFVYILSGEATLVTDEGELQLQAGMCAGFAAGAGDAHHLINRSAADVWYLEVGDRSPGDEASYPDDDLKALLDVDGRWHFLHKDGRTY